jgi:hypothetical protein
MFLSRKVDMITRCLDRGSGDFCHLHHKTASADIHMRCWPTFLLLQLHMCELGMVIHAYKPSTWEAEAGRP